MNIDEAIKHAEEKAKELRNDAETLKRERAMDFQILECLECAKEHEQLAEWLTELKRLRETMEMIKKYYILVEKSPRDNPNDFMMGKVVPDVLQDWRYER